MLVSAVILIASIPLAILISRLLSRDGYERNIYVYGLVFSNFGFMGNAVVKALYPDIFLEYLLFTMPMWAGIYMWGVPSLLLGDTGEKQTLTRRLKSFLNPMFIAMIIGAVIGLTGLELPDFLSSAFTVAGDCMSPVAMLLTGATVAAVSFKRLFLNYKVYIASAIRLIGLPLIFYSVSLLIPLETVSLTCAAAFMCMPLGLNTIVIPGAYGKDTSLGAAMAIISHILGCITIPLMMMLFGL
jgi:predicted permease